VERISTCQTSDSPKGVTKIRDGQVRSDRHRRRVPYDGVRENAGVGVPQFYQQLNSEHTWEDARKPYYNVSPSIVPMLTRLNLDLDSGLIQLPLPALCIRLPKQHNPLAFRWQDQPIEIRSILLSDIGETIDNGETYHKDRWYGLHAHYPQLKCSKSGNRGGLAR
jgi:hypothetical protein